MRDASTPKLELAVKKIHFFYSFEVLFFFVRGDLIGCLGWMFFG